MKTKINKNRGAAKHTETFVGRPVVRNSPAEFNKKSTAVRGQPLQGTPRDQTRAPTQIEDSYNPNWTTSRNFNLPRVPVVKPDIEAQLRGVMPFVRKKK